MAAGDVSVITTTPTGNALLFDGLNDFVDIPITNLNLKSNNPRTVSLWCYFNALANWTTIFAGDDATDFASFGRIQLNDDAQNKLCFVTSGAGDNVLSSGISPSLKTWRHVAITMDEYNVKKIYVDGLLKNSIGVSVLNNAVTSIKLGKYSAGGTHFSGRASSVRIWNRALTAAEIYNDFNSPKSISGNNLIAAYSFSVSAHPEYDDVGDNTLTISGAVVTGGYNSTRSRIQATRVTANDKYGFVPLGNGQEIMCIHVEEA